MLPEISLFASFSLWSSKKRASLAAALTSSIAARVVIRQHAERYRSARRLHAPALSGSSCWTRPRVSWNARPLPAVAPDPHAAGHSRQLEPPPAVTAERLPTSKPGDRPVRRWPPWSDGGGDRRWGLAFTSPRVWNLRSSVCVRLYEGARCEGWQEGCPLCRHQETPRVAAAFASSKEVPPWPPTTSLSATARPKPSSATITAPGRRTGVVPSASVGARRGIPRRPHARSLSAQRGRHQRRGDRCRRWLALDRSRAHNEIPARSADDAWQCRSCARAAHRVV